jgi:capsular exopolysaccharide synthesis family protein
VQQVKSAGGRIDSVASISANPLVAELRRNDAQAERTVNEVSQRYGPMHPKMVEAKIARDAARAALDRQLDQIAASVQKEYEIARDRENQIAGELGSAKGEMQDLNRKQYQLSALQRDVDSNKQLFDMFQTRFKENSASSGMETANARIVEAARVPKSPVYPNKQKAIMVGLLLGLTLGISLAFLLDHMDNTLKGGEDVERRLNVPVLGLLPKLKTSGKKDYGPLSYFKEQPKSSFSEAVRTIRTGVLLSAIDHPHRRVLVTSSVPGEGKTTLASNLAYALGQMRKVLLIDADMRRPSVHRGLPETSEAKGLSHFVSGEANISDCMTHIADTNLYVMRAGAVPPNPLELLSSKRFEDALEGLSKAFDHVIIDCAPACAVSDALVLSRMVHAVVYVIRSDSTPWQLADQGLKRLRRVNAPLVGAVVNQVLPRKGRYGYGYSYAYGKYYYYGDGYYHDYGYNAGKK